MCCCGVVALTACTPLTIWLIMFFGTPRGDTAASIDVWKLRQ